MKENELLEKLGQKLKIERVKRNLSQQKLAEMSNMSMHFLGCVERAEQSITITKLLNIAKALDIPIHELLKFD